MQASGSIVLSKLQINNDQYQIISSAEDIVRFKSKNVNGDEVYETSPQVLKIELLKNGTAIDFSGNYCFYVLEGQDDLSSYLSFGEYATEEEVINTKTLYFKVQEFVRNTKAFQTGTHIFIYEYRENNQVIVSQAFQFRDGVSTEMAEFNINAAAINASIRDSQMSFTENGLEIKNGDLKIYQKTAEEEVQVFGFETKQINDQSVSKLTVRGAIYADEGEFTGSIHATDAQFDGGTIGGFKIEKDKLTSLKSQKNEKGEEIPHLTLDGENGKIIAEYIDLGKGAKITDSIQLGNAYIYNPTPQNSNIFLQAGSILIKDNGTANFGKIAVNGNTSKIEGSNWHIDNNSASFQNVNVSGAIETAIFKTNTVQAAGGSLIFRPSYKGQLSLQGDLVRLDFDKGTEYLGRAGNRVQIGIPSSGAFYTGQINSIEDGAVLISVATTDGFPEGEGHLIDYGADEYLIPEEYYPLENEVYYYKDESSGKVKYEEDKDIKSSFEFLGVSEDDNYLSNTNLTSSNGFLSANNTALANKNGNLVNSIKNRYIGETFLMGINAGNVGTGWEGRVLPKGLTITSLREELRKPKLFLGELNQIGYSGFGLYADNVFLNGSLTTKVEENSYAGVNTLDGTNAIAFGTDFKGRGVPNDIDTSKIVFWAGAKSKESNDIQEAYFQVTENGSVYASRAKLVDTLVVGGTLQATQIHTASLHGNESGLDIYDGSKGIRFISQNKEVLFSVSPDGLKTENLQFINISNNGVEFVGNALRTDNSDNYLQLSTIYGSGGKTTPVLQHYEGNNSCGFYFEKNSTSFRMNDKTTQEWNENGTVLHNELELINETSGPSRLNYKPVDSGYDLYVMVR